MSYYDQVCQTTLDLLKERVGAILKKKNQVIFQLSFIYEFHQNSAVSGYWLYCFCQLEYTARQQELLKK